MLKTPFKLPLTTTENVPLSQNSAGEEFITPVVMFMARLTCSKSILWIFLQKTNSLKYIDYANGYRHQIS